MLGNSCPAERPLACQEGVGSMELGKTCLLQRTQLPTSLMKGINCKLRSTWRPPLRAEYTLPSIRLG
jgi:hypothetical protein